MSDIPNTGYITINKDGVFVGGKTATTYREGNIGFLGKVKENFAEIQRENPGIQELHVGAFDTAGFFAKPGNPSGNFGKYAWCRVKLFDGRFGDWVFGIQYSFSTDCASFGALYCTTHVCNNFSMRLAVLNAVLNMKNKQKEQYKTISVIKAGSYRITIEKNKQK